MDTKIFVMTHKKVDEVEDGLHYLMQVGKAGKEDYGYFGDDTGDNISLKNQTYCELTGIYWLWKNYTCDIIGICHYRRFFFKDEKLIDKSYIEGLIDKYPIIIPNSSCVKEVSVYKDYQKKHYNRDLDMCREVICEICQQYTEAFDFCMQGILMNPGNMWITKKSIFDQYCEWLFSILFEVEKRIDIASYDEYQKRVMGFLSERLFRVWIYMQPEKITEEKVKLTEIDDLKRKDRKNLLMKQLIELKLQDFIPFFKREDEKNGLIEPLHCEDNFEGKIPVWVVVWRGLENAPEMVRRCIKSLKQHLSREKAVIRMITLENCMKYVSFSPEIIEKYNKGLITDTHLSEVVKMELLYRYGGICLEDTYWVTQDISATDLKINSSRHRFFQFMTEAVWYYWATNDELIGNHLMNDLMDIAIEKMPEIDMELQKSELISNIVLFSDEKMNSKCSRRQFDRIKQEAKFYKLNSKVEYRDTNLVGEKTVYGWWKEELDNDVYAK